MGEVPAESYPPLERFPPRAVHPSRSSPLELGLDLRGAVKHAEGRPERPGHLLSPHLQTQGYLSITLESRVE
jgi:hypothetical protein